MLNILKKYKYIFIVLVVLLIIGLIYYFLSYFNKPSPSPYTSTPSPIVGNNGSFYFVSAQPANGILETPDALEAVQLIYSMPIKLDTVKVVIDPYISFRTNVFPGTPNTLWVEPVGPSYWQDAVPYTITVSSSLSSSSGDSLKEATVYKFYKNTPVLIEGGGDLK